MFSLRNKENIPPFKAPLKDKTLEKQFAPNPVMDQRLEEVMICEIFNKADTNTYSWKNFNVDYQAPPGVSEAKTILAGIAEFSPSEVEVFHLV